MLPKAYDQLGREIGLLLPHSPVHSTPVALRPDLRWKFLVRFQGKCSSIKFDMAMVRRRGIIYRR